MLRGALRPTYQRLRRAAAPLPVLLRRPLCDSSGSGGGPVVVSRDLLAARRAPRDAAASPPAAAPADASAAPPAALFDELDEIPGTAPPLRTQGTDATPVADAAGRGLVGRILQEGAGAAKLDAAPDSEPEWSLALSSSDRVAALEQIREELDFDTLFDEDVKEVAKLTAHELAELEKTRFGHAVGDTPDWGMPGSGKNETLNVYPGHTYDINTIAGRQRPRRRPRRSAGDCKLCASSTQTVDWKNVQLLNEYVGEFGTLSNRRQNGLCRQHHGMVVEAIKRSRQMAFMPYVGRLQLRQRQKR